MTLQQLKEEARREFDEVCYSIEECGITGKNKVLNAEHLGDVSGKLLPEISDFMDSLITKAYEEGRKENLFYINVIEETHSNKKQTGESF